MAFMTSSKFRRPSPPDAPVSGDFDLKEGEEENGDAGDGEAAAAEVEVRAVGRPGQPGTKTRENVP